MGRSYSRQWVLDKIYPRLKFKKSNICQITQRISEKLVINLCVGESGDKLTKAAKV